LTEASQLRFAFFLVMPTTTTKTKPEPDTNTEPKAEIRPSVIKAVNDYVKAEAKTVSQMWAMTEEAMTMFEILMKREEIIGQFRQAFALAHKIEEGKYKKDPEYANFRTTTIRVVSVAAAGRNWVTKKRQQKMGFWKILDLVNDKLKDDEPPPPPPKKAKAKAAATPPPPPPPDDEIDGDDADEETYTEPREKANGEWFARCKHIVQNERASFIRMISECVDRGYLPDKCKCNRGIVSTISDYLDSE
jgi:hypothetical protein